MKKAVRRAQAEAGHELPASGIESLGGAMKRKVLVGCDSEAGDGDDLSGSDAASGEDNEPPAATPSKLSRRSSVFSVKAPPPGSSIGTGGFVATTPPDRRFSVISSPGGQGSCLSDPGPSASQVGDDSQDMKSRVKPPSYWLGLITEIGAFSGKKYQRELGWAVDCVHRETRAGSGMQPEVTEST